MALPRRSLFLGLSLVGLAAGTLASGAEAPPEEAALAIPISEGSQAVYARVELPDHACVAVEFNYATAEAVPLPWVHHVAYGRTVRGPLEESSSVFLGSATIARFFEREAPTGTMVRVEALGFTVLDAQDEGARESVGRGAEGGSATWCGPRMPAGEYWAFAMMTAPIQGARLTLRALNEADLVAFAASGELAEGPVLGVSESQTAFVRSLGDFEGTLRHEGPVGIGSRFEPYAAVGADIETSARVENGFVGLFEAYNAGGAGSVLSFVGPGGAAGGGVALAPGTWIDESALVHVEGAGAGEWRFRVHEHHSPGTASFLFVAGADLAPPS